jgi:hypothetical protein
MPQCFKNIEKARGESVTLVIINNNPRAVVDTRPLKNLLRPIEWQWKSLAIRLEVVGGGRRTTYSAGNMPLLVLGDGPSIENAERLVGEMPCKVLSLNQEV